ncbi:MAG: hypothetical protein KF894_09860 [Labilithrix sp.]|nr:hypothetical protein [Labilithrix sp.]
MTAPVSTRETGPRFALRSAVDLCAFVDDLDEGAAGELLVSSGQAAPGGAVFVERGRVCWAAARGLASRLTQLLMARSGASASTMEGLFRRCKEEGAPLGEVLVARRIVRPEDLRSALLQHTTESLDALCSDDASASFRPRAGGYSPRFTFTTSEVLVRSSARARLAGGGSAHEPSVEEALHPFSEAVAGEWGARFVRLGACAAPLPDAAIGVLPEKSAALLQVGKWAASALDVAATFQDEDALVTTLEYGGSTLIAWRHGRAIVAGRMGAQGPARVLNHRAALRRKRGALRET